MTCFGLVSSSDCLLHGVQDTRVAYVPSRFGLLSNQSQFLYYLLFEGGVDCYCSLYGWLKV